METQFGLVHFLSDLDPVGRAVLAALLALSVASWSTAIAKAARAIHLARGERRVLAGERPPHSPWSRILDAGRNATDRIASAPHDAAFQLSAPDQFVATALGRAVQEESERLQTGMALLATASSAAPFVGLFGTVWSIHHALVAIARTGEGGLDKVAGPVGEALVMTGIGLLVAIPALLAHNALAAFHGGLAFRMEGFAHRVFADLAAESAPSGRRKFPGAAS